MNQNQENQNNTTEETATNCGTTNENKQQDRPKDRKNIYSFLTNAPQVLIFLEANFNFNINKKVIDIKLNKFIYLYDIESKTKKEFKKSILKLIIDLLYYNISKKEKEKIFLISTYFINREFKPSFYLINYETFNIKNITSLNDLYNFILTKGRTKRPIINTTNLNNEILNFCCCCCLDNFKTNDYIINCENCKNPPPVCRDCFKSLNNKCPLCRGYILLNNNNLDNRDLNIKFNNYNFRYNLNINTLDETGEEYQIIYLDSKATNIKFKIFSLYLDTDENLKNNFFDELEEKIFYFSSNFLLNFVMPQYENFINNDLSFIELLKQDGEKTGSGARIMRLLGLNTDGGNDDDEGEGLEQRKNDIYDYLINADGHAHTLQKEFFIFLNKKYILFSNDNDLNNYDIRPQYFNKEYEEDKNIINYDDEEQIANNIINYEDESGDGSEGEE